MPSSYVWSSHAGRPGRHTCPANAHAVGPAPMRAPSPTAAPSTTSRGPHIRAHASGGPTIVVIQAPKIGHRRILSSNAPVRGLANRAYRAAFRESHGPAASGLCHEPAPALNCAKSNTGPDPDRNRAPGGRTRDDQRPNGAHSPLKPQRAPASAQGYPSERSSEGC